MILDLEKEEYFMKQAILLGKECVSWGDVPVGCVIVQNNHIIGQGQNRRERNKDSTAHAEILALREASQHLGTWRLQHCHLYVSLEPCPMCMGGILQSKIEKVYFGGYEHKTGCCGSVLNLAEESFGHKPQIYGGILQKECESLMTDFFQSIRNKE